MYTVIKPIGITFEGKATSYPVGVVVDLSKDDAARLLAAGRIAPVGAEDVEPVELDEDKQLKDHTVPELVEIAKKHGVPSNVVSALKKHELVEAISRLTHTSED